MGDMSSITEHRNILSKLSIGRRLAVIKRLVSPKMKGTAMSKKPQPKRTDGGKSAKVNVSSISVPLTPARIAKLPRRLRKDLEDRLSGHDYAIERAAAKGDREDLRKAKAVKEYILKEWELDRFPRNLATWIGLKLSHLNLLYANAAAKGIRGSSDVTPRNYYRQADAHARAIVTFWAFPETIPDCADPVVCLRQLRDWCTKCAAFVEADLKANATGQAEAEADALAKRKDFWSVVRGRRSIGAIIALVLLVLGAVFVEWKWDVLQKFEKYKWCFLGVFAVWFFAYPYILGRENWRVVKGKLTFWK